MDHSYSVRIWAVETYRGKRISSYRVRWVVDKSTWRRTFRTSAAAKSFRSELVAAHNQGIAFDNRTGLPFTMNRSRGEDLSWYAFACQYVDMKWPTISPKHRKGLAEVLGTVTVACLKSPPDQHTARRMRSALLNWGFNKRRGSEEQPADVTALLATIARTSRPLRDLADPVVLRRVLDAGATKVDGTRASGRTATWKRSVLSTALKYAVERGLLAENPVPTFSWKQPRTVTGVDRRSVINPAQARLLLEAVARTPSSGSRLVAFFGAMYYSALRPEEAVTLRIHNLELPQTGWGWLLLDGAASEVERQWTDTGRRREERELKHRARGETRRTPCPPALVELLKAHIDQFGLDSDGRLFRGERGGMLAGVTYTRLWDRARKAAFSPEQYASPLARRPYDLRHAAVSTWLNSGVAPTQVAEWAGHTVEVLLRAYAKCLDGGEAAAIQRIQATLSDQGEQA